MILQRELTEIPDAREDARFRDHPAVCGAPHIRFYASAEQAQRVADAIREALRPPFDLGSVRLPVRASIGVALAPPDERDGDAFLERADAALYAAKAVGRDRIRIAS